MNIQKIDIHNSLLVCFFMALVFWGCGGSEEPGGGTGDTLKDLPLDLGSYPALNEVSFIPTTWRVPGLGFSMHPREDGSIVISTTATVAILETTGALRQEMFQVNVSSRENPAAFVSGRTAVAPDGTIYLAGKLTRAGIDPAQDFLVRLNSDLSVAAEALSADAQGGTFTGPADLGMAADNSGLYCGRDGSTVPALTRYGTDLETVWHGTFLPTEYRTGLSRGAQGISADESGVVIFGGAPKAEDSTNNEVPPASGYASIVDAERNEVGSTTTANTVLTTFVDGVRTSDGGAAFLGFRASSGIAELRGMIFARISLSGGVQVLHAFHGASIPIASRIARLDNGGFAVLGCVSSGPTLSSRCLRAPATLLFLDEDGEVTGEKVINEIVLDIAGGKNGQLYVGTETGITIYSL